MAYTLRLSWFRANVYSVLIGKPERTRQLEKQSCRWEDNIKMDLKEKGCENVH
jgi:hypothetical protein